MNIQKQSLGEKLILALEGRLDTTTAPQLEAELKKSFDGVKELEFDFADLKYLSSAGLRVILAAQKVMNKQGSMLLRNVNEEIMDIFEVTGFVDILTFEEPLKSAETSEINS
ncbi:MAG: STAS domain-containing protein [Oscillospiraceae bacterium]